MKLTVVASILAVASATDCSTLKGAGQKACNADPACTWCKSGAVPPSCYAVADAKKLPPAVFICDSKPAPKRRSEILGRKETEALGVVWRGNSSKADSHGLLTAPASYPDSFTWCNKDGKNYCTMSRNQHIPQYCGSCWAHGTISALGDRVKIARKAEGIDVNLAVQHVLTCGGVGSCYGGTVDGTYQWIKKISDATGTGVSYETANPYIACSSDSKEGFCGHVDTTCTPLNVARTCGSFDKEGGDCTGLSKYPNVTISDYGSISGKDAMMKEIFARGPIACGIDAAPLLNFETGIISDPGQSVDHVISVVGWGMDAATKQQYWIVRNSWGEYWGDMGYVKVAFGALQIEQQCSWAVPKGITAVEFDNQVHCHEGGDNCKASAPTSQVVV
jgi:cathepsin X